MVESALTARVSEGLSAKDVDALNALFASLLGMTSLAQGYVPIIAPAMLLGAPELEKATEQMQPPEGMGVVHESQVFQRGNAIPLGAPLVVEGRFEKSGAAQKLGFTLNASGQSLGEMVTRLRFVTPDVMSTLKGAQFKPSMNDAEMHWLETEPFSRECVALYLDLSQDPNPIHRCDEGARIVGLSQAVVPGMLIAGLCEAALDSIGFRSFEMRTRFMAPLVVGAAMRIGVKVTDGVTAKARAFAISGKDRIVAISDFRIA